MFSSSSDMELNDGSARTFSVSLSAANGALSDGCPSGTALREARRLRGLSQSELAQLLNISQSRVSAWERGYDDVPNRIKLRLVDILTNKRGVLNPLLNRLILGKPNIAIYSPTITDGHPDIRWVHAANQQHPRFSISNEERVGHRVSQYFDLQWSQRSFSPGSARDKLMIDVERDVTTTDAYGAQCLGRRRFKHIFLEFEGFPQLVLTSQSDYFEATGAPPVVHNHLCLDELDC